MRRWGLLVSCVVALCAGFAPPALAAPPEPVGAACDAATLGPEERVLVFSETTGFRHDSIPAGRTAVCEVAGADGIAVDWTEDSSNFTAATLGQYDAVVFLSTTGDPLSAAEQTAFEAYIQAGGGFAGIHAASDTEYDWAWYGGLVGAYFESHPANQNATVKVSDRKHPSTGHLPQRWQRFDEWYSFRSNPRGSVHVLATLDESTYTGGVDGADHPTAWCHNYDGGRSWYTGGGHTIESYSEPSFRQHLLGGIKWAARLVEGDCGGTIWSSFERVTLAKTAAETGEPMASPCCPTAASCTPRATASSATPTPTATPRSPPTSRSTATTRRACRASPSTRRSRPTNWVYLYYAPPLSTPGGDAPTTGTAAQFAPFNGQNYLTRFTVDPATRR